MKTLKMILCLSLLLIGCAKVENQPDMKYGSSLMQLIENDTDQRTAELYQQFANKEYASVSFSHYNHGLVNSVEFENADKLTELFDLIDPAIVDLNYFGPGRTIEDLDAADSFFVISAVDEVGGISQFTLYADIPHVVRFNDDSKDYLIDLSTDCNLYSYFDFVYVEAESKPNEIAGEWIWANADTPAIYDSCKAFKLTEWESDRIYTQKIDMNYEDLDTFDKAMNAIVTLGCVSMPPASSFELFIYIMKNYPVLHVINPDLIAESDEIHYLDGDEEKVIYLSEPIPHNSVIMTGEQFRAAYRELFGSESSFNESTSWHYSPQWFVSGQYLKNEDLYVYYVYAAGAVSNDYTGWIMNINDQQESQGIVTIKASVAYTEIKDNVHEGRSDCFIYRQDYSLIDASKINLSLSKLDELLNVFKDDLLQLEIKLKAHADGTYSIVSIEALNEQDVTQVVDPSKSIINVYKVSDNDWTPIPQFNLSGMLAREVNEQLYYLSTSQKDKFNLKVYEDDAQAYVVKTEKSKQGDEPISGYRYDKIMHRLTDFDGSAITYFYLDQFGIAEDYHLYHDFDIDHDRQ